MLIPINWNQYVFRRKPTRAELNKLILLFNSWVTFYLFEKIHSEFVVKSRGLPDSLGVKWKPLSESRRLYKPLLRGERTQFKIGRRKRTKKELLADRNPPINIDTQRLIKALAPGRVVGGVYYPVNRDQDVTITKTGIRFNLRIPYGDEVQAARPFIPTDLNPWLRLAIDKATPHLTSELQKYVLI